MQHRAGRLDAVNLGPDLTKAGVAHDGAILGSDASTGPHRFGCGSVRIAKREYMPAGSAGVCGGIGEHGGSPSKWKGRAEARPIGCYAAAGTVTPAAALAATAA